MVADKELIKKRGELLWEHSGIEAIVKADNRDSPKWRAA
jgi:hypothetical protein